MRIPSGATGRGSSRAGVSNRLRRSLVVAAVVAVAVFVLAGWLSAVFIDVLWFDALGLRSVWTGVVGAKVFLGSVFAAIVFALALVSATLADRFAPPVRSMGQDDELVVRYHEIVGTRHGLVRLGVSVALALLAGVPATGAWRLWLLFVHGRDTGVTDAQFGLDVGYHLFKVPFLGYLSAWVFAVLGAVLLVTSFWYYLNGGLRVQPGRITLISTAKAHLSVILAAMALVKAADYYFLRRPSLTLGQGRVVDGATFTSVKADLPATILLSLVSLFAAGLFLANIKRRGWALPAVAVGLWAVLAMVVSGIYPALVQRFQVEPNASSRETPYIRNNIDATRLAFGIDGVETTPFDYQRASGERLFADNQATLEAVPLLDPTLVTEAFDSLQSDQPYYSMNSVDSDRYVIDGKVTPVVISARELNRSRLPQQGWEAQRLVFTHGSGAAVAPANAVTDKGRPNFILSSDAGSSTDEVKLTRPEIYHGERDEGYVIVGSGRSENDGDYKGKGGIVLDSLFRRAATAIKFREVEPLISKYVTEDSRLMYRRRITERLNTVAPFVHWDSDPYPVISEGRIEWVIDGYTISDRYPNSQRAITDDLPASSELSGLRFNYIRNSVKATVDAYDGDVHLYLSDELYGAQDPIIRAWARVFPDLFEPIDEMPKTIWRHLRYPMDLFRVQTRMWGRYHVSDPSDFFEKSDLWRPAPDPGGENPRSAQSVGTAPPAETPTTADENDGSTSTRLLDPTYLLFAGPGDEDVSFQSIRPFVQVSKDTPRKVLVSFITASNDTSTYGKLRVFEMSTEVGGQSVRNESVDGPVLAQNTIDSDRQISQQITLLGGTGSVAIFGQLLMVPLKNTILYVRPLFVSGEREGSVPEFRKVAVGADGQAAMGNNLSEALADRFPGGDAASEDTSGTRVKASDATTLLARAARLFDEADDALSGPSGLGDYQEKIEEARQLVDEAALILAGGGTTGTASTSGAAPADSTAGPSPGSDTDTTSTTAPASTTTLPANRASTTTTPSGAAVPAGGSG